MARANPVKPVATPGVGIGTMRGMTPSLFLPEFAEADATRGPGVMVVAEIGVNHDGDAGRAEALIRAAAEAGADAVKFQLFRPERLLSAAALLAVYQNGKADDAKGLLDKLTLPLDAMRQLGGVARSAGVGFIVTPFSLDDVSDMAELAIDAVKIASPDAVNTPLLEAAAGLGRPMFISTGTCDLEELVAAAQHIDRAGGALLQCVSAYPTPEADASLGGVRSLRERFGGALAENASGRDVSGGGIAIGYSDHTTREDTGALAVACGAVVLEKHLTHDRSAPGPDHAASLEPDGLARYIEAVRRAEVMIGPTRKTCLEVERDVRRVSRQSVCLTGNRPANHRLTREDLAVKRPGTGLPAAQLSAVVGRRLARAVPADTPLSADDLSPG